VIKDIYIRNIQDPNYVFGVLEHSDPIESIISKIKVLFGTRPGQIFGDLACGLGIEDYVFETKINSIQLEEKIINQINNYISEAGDYTITPKVSFGRADGYDYCIIDIFINGNKVQGILIK
jgi:hypothetical protein